MNRDELRENLIAIFVRRGHRGKEIVEEVKEILTLIDAELDKARKWDRVVGIALLYNKKGCDGCPVIQECDSPPLCLQAESIVNALEKEPK